MQWATLLPVIFSLLWLRTMGGDDGKRPLFFWAPRLRDRIAQAS